MEQPFKFWFFICTQSYSFHDGKEKQRFYNKKKTKIEDGFLVLTNEALNQKMFGRLCLLENRIENFENLVSGKQDRILP